MANSSKSIIYQLHHLDYLFFFFVLILVTKLTKLITNRIKIDKNVIKKSSSNCKNSKPNKKIAIFSETS